LVRTIKAPSHRLLAMLRAVNEGFVKWRLCCDAAYDTIDDLISKNQNKTTSHIQLAIEDSFKRLLNRLFQMKLYRSQIQCGFQQVLLLI
jgi:transcriptional accessory protein Tex/SPT6